MPSLRVLRNGKHVCTAGSHGLWMFSVNAWADVFGPEASMLDVTGNATPDAVGHSDFLIWECPLELYRGDVIEVAFERSGASAPPGSVFCDDPKQPPEQPKFPWSNPPTEAEIVALETRDAANAATRWRVTIAGRKFVLAPTTMRQHISFRLLWRRHRSDTVRVSLSCSSLREIVARADGGDLFTEELPLDSKFEVFIEQA